MKRTIKFKLKLSEKDRNSIFETMSASAEVFNDHVEHCFKVRSWSKPKAHEALYGYERALHPKFPSALLQATRDNALESVKALKFKFKPHKTSSTSTLRYDKRTFTMTKNSLSLATVNGRVKCELKFADWCSEVMSKGVAKLVQLKFEKQNNELYANVVFDVPFNVTLKQDGLIVGIDRGLTNVAVTSEGIFYSSKKVRKNQRKHLFLRRTLSAKGTRSTRRLLRAISGRERRFSRDFNHCLSKELATDPSVKVYVLEDLTNIRRGKKKGKKFNKALSSWSFCELENFLKYKCEALGVQVVKVDPRYTSQTCSACGHCQKENRSGSNFFCLSCGHKEHADFNAAKNIRDKHVVVC